MCCQLTALGDCDSDFLAVYADVVQRRRTALEATLPRGAARLDADTGRVSGCVFLRSTVVVLSCHHLLRE